MYTRGVHPGPTVIVTKILKKKKALRKEHTLHSPNVKCNLNCKNCARSPIDQIQIKENFS